jgi:hypothetical protein
VVLKSRLSELENSMKLLVSELSQLKSQPKPSTTATATDTTNNFHGHTLHKSASVPAQQFQPHLHQYEPISNEQAVPIHIREPYPKASKEYNRLLESRFYNADNASTGRPANSKLSDKHTPQYSRVFPNSYHAEEQKRDTAILSSSYESRPNLHSSNSSHLDSGRTQNRNIFPFSNHNDVTTSQTKRNYQFQHQNSTTEGGFRGDSDRHHTQAINAMRTALGESEVMSTGIGPSGVVRDGNGTEATKSDDDLVHIVHDIEGKFRLVMKKLELKGLLGNNMNDDPKYFSDAHVENFQKLSRGIGSQQGLVKNGVGEHQMSWYLNGQDHHSGSMEMQQRSEETPVVRGEKGRGPGGFFRPYSDADNGHVNSLSVHTGPVDMKDKGITFFNPKRNVKSCERPTPNIGDCLALDDVNYSRSSHSISQSSSVNNIKAPEKPSSTALKDASQQCQCSLAREFLASELDRRGEEDYEEIIRELESKVRLRVKTEAQLTVLRLMKKAERNAE